MSTEEEEEEEEEAGGGKRLHFAPAARAQKRINKWRGEGCETVIWTRGFARSKLTFLQSANLSIAYRKDRYFRCIAHPSAVACCP